MGRSCSRPELCWNEECDHGGESERAFAAAELHTAGLSCKTKVFLGGWVAPETKLYLTAGSWQKPLFNMAAANKTLIEGSHARNSKHDVRTDDPKT